ncbi:hypothetical protein BDN72DRAFT_505028 [Pluteus cervinus]|uniref:Uncharacterized protein n=1 Tax=Pluteus cervinus TaxID=181527 RepID=A0ACD3AYZ1_9AGAR|nr:hypothetical protein BDN72DRAFT_505028 [Pluteus cervinus]
MKLWSTETGAHLKTFELPRDPIIFEKFLALPSKNHFTFMNKKGRVSVFDPNISDRFLMQLELEGPVRSICYTPDETSLAIYTRESHLYFQDLSTSKIQAASTSFRTRGEISLMAISPDNELLAVGCKPRAIATFFGPGPTHPHTAVVEVYGMNIDPGSIMRTLQHVRSEPFAITEIVWSKDQRHVITITQTQSLPSQSFCCLWGDSIGNADNLWEQDLGGGSAGFDNTESTCIIVALDREIRLIDRSTLQLVVAIPLNISDPGIQRVLGHHGLVMTSFHGGLVVHEPSAARKSSHSGASPPLPRAYRENIFQNGE